ncbi:Mur ligase domain-containing protein [Syntrophaceticus schinkii]|uniref:UDP-N-acetylmuramoyl-L-alanyl-D-glutamate--2, 6-diaminopimelate ligase n=1 Tax=Syntrophaceticus schinkii TaxID=499207 RepID=A0A0B7MNS5_9FIRM
MPITFQDLLQDVELVTAAGLERVVTGLHYDSRQIQPGYIFVCIQGYRTDGHLFIQDALSRGAVGLVIEKDIDVPSGIAFARVNSSRLALALMAANFYDPPQHGFHLDRGHRYKW